jgi:hypothetical protein
MGSFRRRPLDAGSRAAKSADYVARTEDNMKYCGIDLHSNNSVVCVIDEADHVVAERRLPNELMRIVTFLAGWKEELAGVVVESTYEGRPGIMHGLSLRELECAA